MAVINAHVGFFSYFSTEADDPVNERFVNTAAWQGNWACEYTPVTPSGSGDGTLVLPVIGTPTWTVAFPLDSDQYDEIIELVEGNVLYTAFFGLGGSGLWDQVERTTITSVQVQNNNGGDAVRIVITGMGGRVTEGVGP